MAAECSGIACRLSRSRDDTAQPRYGRLPSVPAWERAQRQRAAHSFPNGSYCVANLTHFDEGGNSETENHLESACRETALGVAALHRADRQRGPERHRKPPDRLAQSRGLLIATSAGRPTKARWAAARKFAEDRGVTLPSRSDLQYGGIIGAAIVTDCVSKHASPWFEGPNGLVLAERRPLPFVPITGRLGLFDPPLSSNSSNVTSEVSPAARSLLGSAAFFWLRGFVQER
jgi:hypothetical protein